MFAQKYYNYENCMSMKWHQQSIRFCIHCECSLSPQARAQTFSCFANLFTACARFSLSIKKQADIMLVCYYVSMLCSLVITRKLSELLFWKFTLLKDVISSNLVLIILALYRSSVQICLTLKNCYVVILKTG